MGFTGAGHPEGISSAIEQRFQTPACGEDFNPAYVGEAHAEPAAEDLKQMDARIFREEPMGLRA